MLATEALDLWLSEGHIDSALADQLTESLAAHDKPRRTHKTIATLVSIGAALVGIGLLLFIASHWDHASPTRRLALLAAIFVVAVAAAVLAERRQLTTTAQGLWFLSSISVGVNIFLAGQVFNAPLTYWQGTLLWMIATLAIGWASPSSAQGWLAVPLGLLTLGWLSTPNAVWFEQGAFLFDSAGLGPLLPCVGIALSALAVIAGDTTTLDWLRRPAAGIGSALVAFPIVISTFHPTVFGAVFRLAARPFHACVIFGAVAIVALAWKRTREPLLVPAAVTVTGLLVALLPQVPNGSWWLDRDTTSWLTASFADSALLFGLYTALIVGLAVATILGGEHYAKRGLVNIGFASLSAMLFALYIGRIAGSLPTSIAVIGGGVLLIGGGIALERRRRDTVAAVATRATGAPQ